jgi:hypothetical protein
MGGVLIVLNWQRVRGIGAEARNHRLSCRE